MVYYYKNRNGKIFGFQHIVPQQPLMMETGHLFPMVSLGSRSWFSMTHSISPPIQHGFLPLEKQNAGETSELWHSSQTLHPEVLLYWTSGSADMKKSPGASGFEDLGEPVGNKCLHR